MTIQTFDNVKTLITHARCPDGTASALIVQDALRRKLDIKFMQYTTPEHINLPATPGMLFVDFSPPRERLQEFVDAGALCLDHHKSQRDIIEAFGPEHSIYGDEANDPGVSGAVLAWQHIWQRHHPEANVSDSYYRQWVGTFARLIGVRDTWQKASSDWDVACATASALMFFPSPEDAIALGLPNLCEGWNTRYGWAGAVTYDKHQARAKYMAEHAYRWTSPSGTKLALFQGATMASDATEHVPDADLVVGFDVQYEGNIVKYIYSSRSRKDFDCASFAKKHGGGGHVKAAGFSWAHPACDPYMLFTKLLP